MAELNWVFLLYSLIGAQHNTTTTTSNNSTNPILSLSISLSLLGSLFNRVISTLRSILGFPLSIWNKVERVMRMFRWPTLWFRWSSSWGILFAEFLLSNRNRRWNCSWVRAFSFNLLSMWLPRPSLNTFLVSSSLSDSLLFLQLSISLSFSFSRFLLVFLFVFLRFDELRFGFHVWEFWGWWSWDCREGSNWTIYSGICFLFLLRFWMFWFVLTVCLSSPEFALATGIE